MGGEVLTGALGNGLFDTRPDRLMPLLVDDTRGPDAFFPKIFFFCEAGVEVVMGLSPFVFWPNAELATSSANSATATRKGLSKKEGIAFLICIEQAKIAQ